MHEIPDAGLVEQFARSESGEAFAELVGRHQHLSGFAGDGKVWNLFETKPFD